MSGASDVHDVTASLTAEQQTVLQAIYDYFREHATWPKFITIDRPLRRDHKWDTAAIVQSLPASVIVPPNRGMRPTANDELRLRLLGIEACAGGSEDTARFVRLLRWLAEREETYEPPPGSDDEMPKVTSDEIEDCDECWRTTFLPDGFDMFGGTNSTGVCVACGYERSPEYAYERALDVEWERWSAANP